MIRRILLRPHVYGDLRVIAVYLSSSSAAAADRFIASANAALDDLAAMPQMGSPKYFRSRRLLGIRSWSIPGFRNYLILYRALPDGIDVLAVTHGARELRSLLLGRQE
jgi:plasmid stabilization system protein ParE